VSEASEVNRAFYDAPSPGRNDYWRKMAAPRARVAEILREVQALAPASLVELGPGGGQLLREIHVYRPGIRLSGIDLSRTQIDQNRRTLPEVDWHVGNLDVEGVPADLLGAFDLVVASEIIEHVDRPEVFLRNASALARERTGYLVLSTQSGLVRETERRVGHRRHFEPFEMKTLLEQTGWGPVRIWNAGFPFHDLSKWYANRDPDGSVARFAGKSYGLYENAVCLGLRALFRLNSATRGAQLYAVAKRGP
jgi:SAM-dependent methyltransferase